jgi:hypothetical protein
VRPTAWKEGARAALAGKKWGENPYAAHDPKVDARHRPLDWFAEAVGHWQWIRGYVWAQAHRARIMRLCKRRIAT